MVKREPLTQDRIVAAALRLLDGEGLEALTMRRLGTELGVEAMSLYNHVSGRAEILDGVHEAILEEMRPPRPSRSWTATLRALAQEFRRVLRAHPNALPIFATRPAVAPGSLRQLEAALQILREAGFRPLQALHAVQSLLALVVGNALWRFGSVPDAEIRPPRYARLSREEFPRLTEIFPLLAAYDAEAEFEFGLDALLAGLAARRR